VLLLALGCVLGGVLAGPRRAAPSPAKSPVTTLPTSPAEARRLLHRRLSALARTRRGVQGLVVIDGAGRELFSRRAARRFNPASNVKLLSLAAALATLGPGYRFTTEICGQRRGRVARLYLRGGGDPSLRVADLRRLVRALWLAGLRELSGPLIVDISQFPARPPPGFAAFRSDSPYRAIPRALNLESNVAQITIAPGAAAGAPARVTVQPASSYLALKPTVRTSRWGTRLRIRGYRRGSVQTGLRVWGQLRAGSAPRRSWKRVYHPELYAGATLLSLLARAGVKVRLSRVRRGRTPRRLPVLARHRSRPLGQLTRRTLKHSLNLWSEAMLLAAGRRRFGGAASYPKARRLLRSFLVRRLRLGSRTFTLPNGSGLARRARISPSAMARALLAIHRDFAFGPELLAGLPLLGVDGTLRYFKRATARGSVRAKTGTLAGTSCLSGYVSHGRQLAFFAFMGYRVRRLHRLRRRHVAMADAVRRYLRSQARPIIR
jgi:D-alanyl-D-alanine carboxypeptidase/D-alanyl-D-alanine-endopeptidase (penicillin-binding protein 4)